MTTTKTATAKKAPRIGAVAVELMLKGKTDAQVLSALKKRFPKAKTSENSISWYRSTARKNKVAVPLNSELEA